ncbi:MAG: hypothetical protein ABW044_10780 [Cellvibrio sp.]
MAGVYSSLGFALPVIDTSVCFQRSASGAHAVLPDELEDELTTELELELELEPGLRLELATEFDFELLELFDLIEEAEDRAFEAELLAVLPVLKLMDEVELSDGDAPVPVPPPPPQAAKPTRASENEMRRVAVNMAIHHSKEELFAFPCMVACKFLTL